MRTIPCICSAAIAVIVIIAAKIPLSAQISKEEPMFTRLEDVKFEHLPFLPDCLMIHSERGDPLTGPSQVLSRMTPGCVIPWHWHSPNENMLVVSGAYENEPRGEKALLMHSGDYAYLPSRHQHRGMCRGPEPCIAYLSSDAAADVHWIDEQGNEISVTDALKAANSSHFAPVKTPELPDTQASATHRPRAIRQVDPEYPEEGSRARISGSVLLSLTVGTDGLAHDVEVKKSLGHGFDENAMLAFSSGCLNPRRKMAKQFLLGSTWKWTSISPSSH